jgi:hypothetical protein
MTNRSNISGNKPQQVRKPVPKETLPTPAEVEKAIKDQDMDAVEAALYNDQGKLAPSQVDTMSADLIDGDSELKKLAKDIEPDRNIEMQLRTLHASKTVEELEGAVNHRSGMSYSELKEAYEEQKTKAEEAGEMLNAVRTVINNPFHRYGQFVDSIPLGRALKMEKVWQPKESR